MQFVGLVSRCWSLIGITLTHKFPRKRGTLLAVYADDMVVCTTWWNEETSISEDGGRTDCVGLLVEVKDYQGKVRGSMRIIPHDLIRVRSTNGPWSQHLRYLGIHFNQHLTW